MKWNKKLKKIILGSTGFAMAAVIFFVGSMQSMNEVAARVRVFDKITEKYPAGSMKMNILEIVPYADTTVNNGQTVSAYSELGYFLKNKEGNQNTSLIAATHGTLHSNGADSTVAEKYPSAMFQLRTYGMIRPSGSDAGKTYPIYMLKDSHDGGAIAAFLNYQATNYALYEDGDVYVKGVYSLGTGEYRLADGYTLNEDGTICKVEEVVVSGNSVSGNGVVSGNEIETKLIPVTDIDMSKQQLPTSTSGFAYITKVEEGAGNLIFTRSETVTQKTEYYGVSDQALYYSTYATAYFGSSDYFREFVLGDRKAYANSNITYNTKQASTVTVEEVQAADLIYISGKSVDFSSSEASDLKEAVMLEIYNQEVLNRKAVMMDYACYSADSDSNVSKLATLLWRESQSDIKSSYPDAYKNADGTDSNAMKNVAFMEGDALKDLQGSMMTGSNGNFVTGNLYVYNHHLADFDNPKSLIDAGDIFANGDFNTPYKASVTQTGFAEVMAYITSTNKVSTTGTMPASVSPAVAIQYILISDGNPLTVMKSSLHVLEIQPVTSFLFNEKRGSDEYAYIEGTQQAKNREDFILSYLGDYYDDKHDYIMFTSMTIDEFNGRNEDLVETYDVIYIGSEMGSLYNMGNLTTKKMENGVYTANEETKSLPTYADTNMNGMVYYNIGDILTTKDRGNDLYEHIGSFESRYNGRDLTKDKLAKLKLYLQADGLVLVAGDLMATDANGNMKINPTEVISEKDNVDHGRVDTSSNMYELLMFSQGGLFDWEDDAVYEFADEDTKTAYKTYPNMVSVGDFATGVVKKADIERYIATEKLALTMIDTPNEYAYEYQKDANGNLTSVLDPDSIVYMEEDVYGNRKLSYDFVITSLSGELENEPSYIPSLYIDVNKDGKYSKSAENVRDIQVVVKATGAEAPRDAANNYLLSKDVEYQLTRELDSQFSGYLQWKLSIQSSVDPLVHASAEGSTVVKNQGTDKLIKILQINKNTQSSLNLETESESATSKFKTYLENVPGYKVQIKSVTSNDFVDGFAAAYAPVRAQMSVEEFAGEFFDTYVIDDNNTPDVETDDIIGANMLVFGYGDNYESITTNADEPIHGEWALRALKSFIESEKPVLMTHDFMVYYAAHAQSTYLRHLMGVDKYGVTLNIETDDGITTKDLVSKLYYNGNGKDYLHTGIGYVRSDENDAAKVKLIESTGKTVAYQPTHSSTVTVDKDVVKVVDNARSMTDGHTQGISNYTLYSLCTKGNKWLNSDKVTNRASDDLAVGRGSYIAEKINNGQITSYPYLLPDDLNVEHTHAQHLALNLDADDDNDGESDVVVWYALGEKTANKGADRAECHAYNAYSDDAAGPIPADSYYVYNKGNITYTGYGDHTEQKGFTDDEAQLFVNILFAAFNAEQTKPSAGFFETPPTATSEPITGLNIPYDENVTGDNVIDSSILKNASGTAYRHPFINPNDSSMGLRTSVDTTNATPIYYRLNDTNFVRGQKYMTVEYYLKAEGNGYDEVNREYTFDNGKSSDGNAIDDLVLPVTEVNVNDVTMPLVDISDYIATYQVSEGRFATFIEPEKVLNAAGQVVDRELSMMESGVVYGFYLPMSLLNEDTRYTIYIKSKTRVVTQSSQTGKPIVDYIPGEGFSEFTVIKTDLLSLD